MTETIAQLIARALFSIECEAKRPDAGGARFSEARRDMIETLCRDYLPSGSGFDNGTELDADRSTSGRLVFNVGFHHMDSNGFYDGWTHHSVIVTPSLVSGYDLRVTGRNKRDIKDYIAETFHAALGQSLSVTFDPTACEYRFA